MTPAEKEMARHRVDGKFPLGEPDPIWTDTSVLLDVAEYRAGDGCGKIR